MQTFLPPKLTNRFTQRARHALLCAAKFIRSGENLHPTHLLASLLVEQGSLAKNILEAHRVHRKLIQRSLAKIPRIATLGIPKYAKIKGAISFSADCKAIIKRAAQIASRQNQPYIGTEHLLYALVCRRTEPMLLSEKKAKEIKRHLDAIFSQSAHLPRIFTELTPAGSRQYPAFSNIQGGQTKNSIMSDIQNKDHVHGKVAHLLSHHTHHSATPALDTFCENLTTLATEKKLDPVIGRGKEISRMMSILSRRSKNNPLLVGEPGVGKTAIVQGLAQKINDGEVPLNLINKQIYSLNMTSLTAGTMFRGDFEARMYDLLEEASNPNVILFIDEIHVIIGAGSAQGSLDVANILKPGLAQGRLRCIGATTFEEYKKYFEKEKALERRFQQIVVEEESEEESVQTLLSLKPLYEKHHGVRISDEAVRSAVSLSAKYIRDRFLPDKALDLLDEAASRFRVQNMNTHNLAKMRELDLEYIRLAKAKEQAILEENYEEALRLKVKEQEIKNELAFIQKKVQPDELQIFQLQKPHIEETISEITGIPVQKNDDRQSPSQLRHSLACEIRGQKEAIEAITATIIRNRAGIHNPKRPVGSFLFLGPTGVGKTALAKALADAQHQPLIRLDMSEYAEQYTISRLLGSPPGYVGYGEGGELTDKIRRHPYCVVLFDEIEKAHPSIQNLLLQILEDGAIKDATSRNVVFHHAIIILTSNSDTEEPSSGRLGFSKSKNTFHKDRYLTGIKEVLRPEILSRIDKVVVFNALTKKDILEIAQLELIKLQERLRPVTLLVGSKIIPYIAQHAWRGGQGARNVRTTIEKLVELPIAGYLLRYQNVKKMRLEIAGGKVRVIHA